MAKQMSTCSSSIVAAVKVSPSTLKNGTCFLPSSSIIFPSKLCSSKWVSHILSRFYKTKCFNSESPNGHPLNPVSLQDDVPVAPIIAKNVEPLEDLQALPVLHSVKKDPTLSIIVVGASGDLAKKKIFPALFALFYEDFLTENFTIFGYARTKLSDEELRNMISATLTCRVDQRENCADKMDQFLQRCFYHSGQYNSEDDFSKLDCKLKEKENFFRKRTLEIQ